MSSPFAALDLDDDATPTQVRAAWRVKVAKRGVHPDTGGDVSAFKALSEAYRQALHIAENAPCAQCRGQGKVGVGNSSFVKTLLVCQACGGSGKRR